jgi:hypothetical protein
LYTNVSREYKLTIYPNPVQQYFTVEHPRRKTGEIRIYNAAGQLLRIVPVLQLSSKTLLSLSNQPNGRYFLQWISGNEKLIESVIK